MWKVFPRYIPKYKGWYLVTIEIKNQQRYVRELYWYPEKHAFWDNIRENVCQEYTVLNYKNERIMLDCDKTDLVVAWKKRPRSYMKGFIETN